MRRTPKSRAMSTAGIFRGPLLALALLSPLHSAPANADCLLPAADITDDAVTDVLDVQCSILATLWVLSGSVGFLPECVAVPLADVDLNCDHKLTVPDIVLTIQLALALNLSPLLDGNQDKCVDACEGSNLPDICDDVLAGELSVMSYNVRHYDAGDTAAGNGWEKRKGPIIDLITERAPHLAGLQELSKASSLAVQPKDYVSAALAEAGYNAVSGLGGSPKLIFYSAGCFQVVASGSFRLPPYSPNFEDKSGWNDEQILPCKGILEEFYDNDELDTRRTATWAIMEAGEAKLFVLNTHLYHKDAGFGDLIRSGQLECIYSQIEVYAAGLPVVMMGDLNNTNTRHPICSLHTGVYSTEVSLYDTHTGTGDGTLNGFKSVPALSKLDYIFARGVTVSSPSEVVTATYVDAGGVERYPSDHFPVQVGLTFAPQDPTFMEDKPSPCGHSFFWLH